MTEEFAKKHFENYISILKTNRQLELEPRFIEQYDLHIERAVRQLEKMKSSFDISSIKTFLESEVHSFGTSFLPGQHGETTESSFYNLQKIFTDN
jgi:hypothetical protein